MVSVLQPRSGCPPALPVPCAFRSTGPPLKLTPRRLRTGSVLPDSTYKDTRSRKACKSECCSIDGGETKTAASLALISEFGVALPRCGPGAVLSARSREWGIGG
jgi:hypothetical protein